MKRIRFRMGATEVAKTTYPTHARRRKISAEKGLGLSQTPKWTEDCSEQRPDYGRPRWGGRCDQIAVRG